MLISEIRDEAISEVGADPSDTSVQAKFLGYLKSSLRRFPENARARSIISKKSISFGAADQTASVPSGFIQERIAWYEANGRRVEVNIERDVRKFNQLYRNDAPGAPEFMRIWGTTAELSRPTDQAYTVYAECFVEIDAVAAGDTFGFDSSMAEILKDGIKFYYFTYAEEKEQQATFGNLFSGNLKLLDAKYTREEQPDWIEES